LLIIIIIGLFEFISDQVRRKRGQVKKLGNNIIFVKKKLSKHKT